jgi:hypothetical protein
MITNSPMNVDSVQRDRRITSEDKLIEYIKSRLGSPIIDVEVDDTQIGYLIDDTIRKFSEHAFAAQSRIGFIIEAQKDVSEYVLDERISAVIGCSLGGTLGQIHGTANNIGGISLGAFGTIGIGYVPHITLQGEVSSLESGVQGAEETNASGVAGGVSGNNKNALSRMSDAFIMMSHREGLQALFDKAVNWSFNSNTKVLKIFEEVDSEILVEADIEYIPNREYDEIYSEPWVKDYATALVKRQWGENIGKYSQTLVGGAELNYDRIITEANEELQRLEEELLTKWSPALGIFSG